MILGQAVPEEELGEALSGIDTSDWVSAAVIVTVAFAVSLGVRLATARLVRGEEGGATAAHFVSRVVGYLVFVAGFVYALMVLGVRMAPLLGALGIGGLAIAFAAQSVLENVFASVLLQARRPFRRGDQIATNDHEGTVEDVNFRTVVLRTYAGEKVLIPCSMVLGNPITNFTYRGIRRTTLPVGVAYGTNLRDAQQVLLDAVRGVEGVQRTPEVEAWVERFGDSSIDFALRFWHAADIASMWRIRSGVAIAVQEALVSADITIPFPQRDVHFPDRT